MLNEYLKEGSNTFLKEWRTVKFKNKEILKDYMAKVRPDC